MNALLYGEEKLEDEDGHSQKRIRFASRRTAKLPKGLKAATSARPGETRCLSFYQLSAKVDAKKISLLLVDLPGYGFAYASQTQANQWQSLMETYILNGRKSLKRILLLIDSRHGMKKADIDFLESLQSLLLCKKTDLKSHKVGCGKRILENSIVVRTFSVLPPHLSFLCRNESFRPSKSF